MHSPRITEESLETLEIVGFGGARELTPCRLDSGEVAISQCQRGAFAVPEIWSQALRVVMFLCLSNLWYILIYLFQVSQKIIKYPSFPKKDYESQIARQPAHCLSLHPAFFIPKKTSQVAANFCKILAHSSLNLEDAKADECLDFRGLSWKVGAYFFKALENNQASKVGLIWRNVFCKFVQMGQMFVHPWVIRLQEWYHQDSSFLKV